MPTRGLPRTLGSYSRWNNSIGIEKEGGRSALPSENRAYEGGPPSEYDRAVLGLSELEELLLAVEVAILLGGFVLASVTDVRSREVPDLIWQVMGIVALSLGAALVAPGGLVPLALWLVVGLLVLQHMFAWDVRLGSLGERYADMIEVVLYAAVVGLVAIVAIRVGVGPSGVPYAVISLVVTVLFARALFELGVLYGGADAKALMIAGMLLPTFATPVFVPSNAAATVAVLVPFSINLLMDAALVSIVVPIAIGARSAAHHEFSFPRGFTGYTIPVTALPDRFVWVRDPTVGPARKEEEAIETTEDDRRRRVEIARDLEARGITRVWVTPQIPFLVVMTVGAVAALLAGNLLLDLLAVL